MDDHSSRIEILESQLSRLLSWIQGAEARLALVLSLSTAMLGALSVLAPAASQWSVFPAILAAFATVFLGLSVLCSALASFPRTSGPKGSLVYFGGVAGRELNQYDTAIKSLTEEAYIEDLIRQCHRNAQIAEQKYYWIQRSMACLFVSSLPWAGSLFLLYNASP